MQVAVSQNQDNIYKTYPKMIGECGGKNFHMVHSSADVQSVIHGTILSAFEYGGQKCSAVSRAYIPKSMWPKVKEGMLEILEQVKLGDADDSTSFLSAVIDEASFDRIHGYLLHAKTSPKLKIVAGGTARKEKGYFVEPTIVESTDPSERIMHEEIFGPVLTVHPYEDSEYSALLDTVANTSPYALTGAIFCKDPAAMAEARDKLVDSCGNMYLNDKSTGSVVGQQPFGGARMSGTNDKAGGPHYLLRFCSPQAVKESHVPLTTWKYGNMAPSEA